MAISTIWVLKTVVKGIIFTSLLLLFYFLHMRHAIDQYSKGITTIGQEPLKKLMEHSKSAMLKIEGGTLSSNNSVMPLASGQGGL